MKKEQFINEIEQALNEKKIELSEDAQIYFESLKTEKTKEKKAFTENGIAILRFLKDATAQDSSAKFSAKMIGESMFLGSRTVSGSLRKLVTDGYVEKIGEGNPICYILTESGKAVNLD